MLPNSPSLAQLYRKLSLTAQNHVLTPSKPGELSHVFQRKEGGCHVPPLHLKTLALVMHSNNQDNILKRNCYIVISDITREENSSKTYTNEKETHRD